MNHMINNRRALVSVNMAEDVNILNFLRSHITIIHNHRLVIGENRNDISNNQNNVRSTKAVIFAIAANQNSSHAIIMYFSNSFFSLPSSLFLRNINQASKASNDSAITHRSVLLSTITKKAHIPLVNHNNNTVHHIVIPFTLAKSLVMMIFFFDFSAICFLSSSSSFFFVMRLKVWKIIAIQNINTKLALILFIDMVMLSDDNPNRPFVHPVNENMKAKN